MWELENLTAFAIVVPVYTEVMLLCRGETVILCLSYCSRARLDELRMFLENEAWELCPVKSNFNTLQLMVRRLSSSLLLSSWHFSLGCC